MSRNAPPHSPEDADREAIALTASRWVVRRKAGLSPADQAELHAWLAADKRHAAALAAADPASDEFDWPLYSGAVDRVLAGLDLRARRRRARQRKLAAIGAAALIVLGIVFFQYRAVVTHASGTALVVRAPQTQLLPDGSKVELREDAEIRVAFTATERRVQLLRGAAHFDVSKDPGRPFLVTAGTITARAVGTAFLVGLEAHQVALLVSEGKVAVDHHSETAATSATGLAPTPATLALVAAGESIAVARAAEPATPAAATPAPKVSPLPAAEWDQRMGWRTPRLEFHGTPLREVVENVNRHNRTQLSIADRELENLKLSGALRADKIDVLVEMLETDFRVTAVRSEGRIELRRAGR